MYASVVPNQAMTWMYTKSHVNGPATKLLQTLHPSEGIVAMPCNTPNEEPNSGE